MDERSREQKRGLPGDGPIVKTPVLPLQGAWVQYLVGELRSHMLCCMAKKKKKLPKRCGYRVRKKGGQSQKEISLCPGKFR